MKSSNIGRLLWLVGMMTFSMLAQKIGAEGSGSAKLPGAGRGISTLAFPEGTATPSQVCAECHSAIYSEYSTGFGSDLEFRPMVYRSSRGVRLTLPENVSNAATAHSAAGIDPFPIHARDIEEQGRSCNVCHFPEAFDLPDINQVELTKPKPRPKGEEAGGLTCASCHLTPDGKIRGPYDSVLAEHPTVFEPRMKTAAMCAYCHSAGKRVIGKQTQTFLEWREDFNKPGLGRQHCQDCHMPHTLREVADGYGPVRSVGRHLWTGGHSTQRLQSALTLEVVQPLQGYAGIEFHVINAGAGHSVPTGSNRRAVYLKAEVLDQVGQVVANREWMFAPNYGDRPDDKAFLEADKNRPDAVAAMQADAQGPHESTIRAGEDRVLAWLPQLVPGDYNVRASLIYDLNRYNDRSFLEDQTEMFRAAEVLKVEKGVPRRLR